MYQDIIYSSKENEFYNYLFNKYKDSGNELIDGINVANLFSKAKLNKVKNFKLDYFKKYMGYIQYQKS